MSSDYHPISCDFHDVLETLATRHTVVQVRFRDSQSAIQHRIATVTDLFARDGAEYMALGRGEIVRLDLLVAVDEAKPTF